MQSDRDLLEQYWGQTQWSDKQAANIIARIDGALELLPQVARQAHERIIGGRQVPNGEKTLSQHEPDLHTIVRNKAGKEVEFGNGLFLAENFGGFLLDYKLYQSHPPADGKQLVESLARQRAYDTGEDLLLVGGDRQLDTKAVAQLLEKSLIEDMNCPWDPKRLAERQRDCFFRTVQKRRSGTEARIAIFKNNGGRVWRAKGYENRNLAVAYAALTQNLRWLAQTLLAMDESTRQKLLAA